jgi:hypothetical protein
MHKIALATLVSAAILLLAACQPGRVDGLPPTPTAASPAAATAIVAAPATTATLSATLPITAALPAATPALTSTVQVTVTVEAVARQALRIRSGPGVAYPIIGDLAATGRVAVLGRSPDGGWLRVECPAGLSAEACWIIGDASYWQFEETTAALPTSAAPPVPPPTVPPPTPTPVPCVVAPLAGWVAYQISPGDTLSDLAGRFGVSPAQIQAVNCLASDLIVAGASILVPGGAAGGPALPSQGPTAPLPPGSTPAEATIDFVIPNLDDADCLLWKDLPAPDPTQPLLVAVTDVRTRPRTVFSTTDIVCFYVVNLAPTTVQPAVVTVEGAGLEPVSLTTPPAGENAWSYVLKPGVLAPGESSKTLQVQATQGITSSEPVTFTVQRASSPKLRFTTRRVTPGQRAEAIAAGFQFGTQLYLYRLSPAPLPNAPDRKTWQWQPNRHLPRMITDRSKEAFYYVDTLAGDAGHCFLVHTGEPLGEGVNLYDPRVFAVGIDPRECQ